MDQPMSYLLFKLSLEMAYVGTFERDPWVQEQYQKYLDNFKKEKINNEQRKKATNKVYPSFNPGLETHKKTGNMDIPIANS